MLRDLAQGIFDNVNASNNDSEDDEHTIQQPAQVIEDDSYIILTKNNLDNYCDTSADAERKRNMLFNDIFFRPPQLVNMCAWDIFIKYEKQELPKSKKQTKTFLRFQPGHPQYSSHCFKQRMLADLPRVPVLKGYPIPRSDKPDEREKYSVAILALFKPWSNQVERPLKHGNETWEDAYNAWLPKATSEHKKVIKNMQLQHDSRDAKFDYAAQRRQRMSELTKQFHGFSSINDDESDEFDPEWETAMQTLIETGNEIDTSFVEPPEEVLELTDTARELGFYTTRESPTDDVRNRFSACVSLATEGDAEKAEESIQEIMRQKELLLRKREQASVQKNLNNQHHRHQSSYLPRPCITDLDSELIHAQYLHEKYHSSESWNALKPWQQLASALINKHGLNERQILAFLLLADTVGRQLDTDQILPPLRLLVTGPGGTGKSRIFEAWTEFHKCLQCEEQFRLTAPTGVVASDIGGCTVHSEVALRVSRQTMKADTLPPIIVTLRSQT